MLEQYLLTKKKTKYKCIFVLSFSNNLRATNQSVLSNLSKCGKKAQDMHVCVRVCVCAFKKTH